MKKYRILVKIPPEKIEIFQVFPFFILLKEEYPDSDIFIICEEDCSTPFTFLPYKARVFERPKDKVNLIQTHQFVANLHEVFNLDLFFDLENSFNSAFLGFNFRSLERIGFDKGWNKHLLTKAFADEPTWSLEKKSIRLLENYIKKNFSETRIFSEAVDLQIVEKVEKLFKEPVQPKFIMIMLYDLESTLKEIEIWKSFFDGFNNQKFVIWSLHNQDEVSELFAKIDTGKNYLFMHAGTFAKEIIYLFSKVLGVVTNNVWCESLGCYYGVTIYSIMPDTIADFNCAYYRYRPKRIRYPVVPLPDVELTFSLDAADERKFESMNAVIDYLYLAFKL